MKFLGLMGVPINPIALFVTIILSALTAKVIEKAVVAGWR
jgi:hypothetical protein